MVFLRGKVLPEQPKAARCPPPPHPTDTDPARRGRGWGEINSAKTPRTFPRNGPPRRGPPPAGGGDESRRLACDCATVHWLEDSDGNTLNIGRKSRTIPPAIRRALNHRDQGCRFPGCTAHKYTDAHHIHHWADGGETRLDNLVTLCRHHHRAVHEGGFSVQMKVQRSTPIPRSQRPESCQTLPKYVTAETFLP